MMLFGAILAVLVLTLAAWRRPQWRPRCGADVLDAALRRDPGLGRDAGRGRVDLLEGVGSATHNDPTWVGIGFAVADAGLLVLLVTSGVAFWWRRSRQAGSPAGSSPGLAGLYLVLLAVAWLAMSGKWSLNRLQNLYRRGGSFLANGE